MAPYAIQTCIFAVFAGAGKRWFRIENGLIVDYFAPAGRLRQNSIIFQTSEKSEHLLSRFFIQRHC